MILGSLHQSLKLYIFEVLCCAGCRGRRTGGQAAPADGQMDRMPVRGFAGSSLALTACSLTWGWSERWHETPRFSHPPTPQPLLFICSLALTRQSSSEPVPGPHPLLASPLPCSLDPPLNQPVLPQSLTLGVGWGGGTTRAREFATMKWDLKTPGSGMRPALSRN